MRCRFDARRASVSLGAAVVRRRCRKSLAWRNGALRKLSTPPFPRASASPTLITALRGTRPRARWGSGLKAGGCMTRANELTRVKNRWQLGNLLWTFDLASNEIGELRCRLLKIRVQYSGIRTAAPVSERSTSLRQQATPRSLVRKGLRTSDHCDCDVVNRRA